MDQKFIDAIANVRLVSGTIRIGSYEHHRSDR